LDKSKTYRIFAPTNNPQRSAPPASRSTSTALLTSKYKQPQNPENNKTNSHPIPPSSLAIDAWWMTWVREN